MIQMSRYIDYKEEFWEKWLSNDEMSRESMIRDLILRSLHGRSFDIDLLTYLFNTYLEDLAEYILIKICKKDSEKDVDKDLG